MKNQNLLFPKSGSHHHKNIYPQITKSKNVYETKTNTRDSPCPNIQGHQDMNERESSPS